MTLVPMDRNLPQKVEVSKASPPKDPERRALASGPIPHLSGEDIARLGDEVAAGCTPGGEAADRHHGRRGRAFTDIAVRGKEDDVKHVHQGEEDGDI